MQDNRSETDVDVTEKLLKEKFGRMFDWTLPVILKTVGPYTPEAFTTFEVRRTELISECRSVLDKITAPDLAILLHPKFDDPDGKRSAWDELLKSEITQLSFQEPVWLSGGFGHPDFEADFTYWGQMAKYEIHEALLLSVGIEPRHISAGILDNAEKKIGQNHLISPMEYLAKRREQFRRHFPVNYDGWYSIRPQELKSWFDEVSLDVHKGFYSELERRVSRPVEKGKAKPELGVSALERETLLKLIAAMACEQYNFDPDATRSAATSSIRDDLEIVGLSMDSKTILKWLREATALVPKEYWKK